MNCGGHNIGWDVVSMFKTPESLQLHRLLGFAHVALQPRIHCWGIMWWLCEKKPTDSAPDTKSVCVWHLYFTSLLFSTRLFSSLLYSTLLYLYSTLLYSFYSSLIFASLLYSTLLFFTILDSTLLYSSLLHYSLLYSTLLFYSLTLLFLTLRSRSYIGSFSSKLPLIRYGAG